MDKTTDLRVRTDFHGPPGAQSISSDSGIGADLSSTGDKPVARSQSMRTRVCIDVIILRVDVVVVFHRWYYSLKLMYGIFEMNFFCIDALVLKRNKLLYFSVPIAWCA